MRITNNIRREVEIRIKTYEVRYFDEKTGKEIINPKWKLISDEVNYEGFGIVGAIQFLLDHLKNQP